MTLRLRLVIAIVVLSTAGLAVFGVGTYIAYSRSEFQRFDEQIRASVPGVSGTLERQMSGLGSDPFGGGAGAVPPGVPQPFVSPGTYAELRDRNGAFLIGGTAGSTGSSSKPKLPTVLVAAPGSSHFFDADSAAGAGRWRVLVTYDRTRAGDGTVVVAVPLTEVTNALDKLLLIEVGAAAILLAILAVGSWLILRRGLRPLEHMADSARTISTGDLSQRVTPSDERTEVGQLGLALNTMLGEIEEAFRERDETEEKLRQFLADASHELRTPLTSIQGFAELFRLGADQDRVQLEVIFRRIEQESARMKTLVEDLLLLARLDETRPGGREPVDLAVLAADACTDAVATAPDRPVTLDAAAPVMVSGDRDHLRQALANLVTNALRHTPAGSPIEVTAAVDGAEAVLTVRDHGPGLDPGALPRVFDRFWQADSARVGTGAGLGLAIVAAIADEHGGRADVVNAPDGGARFTLRLPLADRDGSARPETAAPVPAGT